MRYKIIRGTLDTSGVQEPQAGPQPLRRQEGELTCPAKVPPRAASSCPTRSTGRCSSPRSSTRSCCAASAPPPSSIVYDALDDHRGEDRRRAVATLKRAIDNVKPQLEVKSRRVGGATYQVPVEVRPRRANTLAIRWIVGYSRQRREKTMAERLANELLDASNGVGASVKRREDMHKMAESNKAFAHYRW